MTFNPRVPPFGAAPDEMVDPQTWMRGQLFDRRIVLVSGYLDDETANRVGVELMTLDALGDEAITLQIDSADGAIAAGLAVTDVIDLLGVPVRATCVGQAAGPAAGILAACDHRTISPHARVRLFEPAIEVQGNAAQLQTLAALHQGRWASFCNRLAEATGKSVEQIYEDAGNGRFFTATEAVAYGLADEIATPNARMYRLPGRPMGFGSH